MVAARTLCRKLPIHEIKRLKARHDPQSAVPSVCSSRRASSAGSGKIELFERAAASVSRLSVPQRRALLREAWARSGLEPQPYPKARSAGSSCKPPQSPPAGLAFRQNPRKNPVVPIVEVPSHSVMVGHQGFGRAPYGGYYWANIKQSDPFALKRSGKKDSPRGSLMDCQPGRIEVAAGYDRTHCGSHF